MIDISIINYIIKILFINLCTTYIFVKSSWSTKVSKKDFLILMLNSIFISITFIFIIVITSKINCKETPVNERIKC